MHPSNTLEDVPGLEGSDYVALVIEWDDAAADVATIVSPAPHRRMPGASRTIAAVLGALGAIVLASWGLRRLQTA